MAIHAPGLNDSFAVQRWQNELTVEALKTTSIHRFMGEGDDSLFCIKNELQKGPGDQVTFGLRAQLTGRGVQGMNRLKGNEEAIEIFPDSIIINQLRNAAKVASSQSISQQRVPYNLRQNAMAALRDWAADRIDTAAFNQLCGNTAETDTAYTGNQVAIAPNAENVLRQGGVANDEALVTPATHSFTLDLIDIAVEYAETLETPIRPLNVAGEKMYVLFLHPYQATDLRLDATTAGAWFDIRRAAMEGGEIAGNDIFTGALGVHNNTIILKQSRITQGVHSSTGASVANTRRAVFCGAQAGAAAFSQNGGPSTWTWNEEIDDYGQEFGVAASCIFGFKKTRFNSKDFGTITIPTYAALHTGA